MKQCEYKKIKTKTGMIFTKKNSITLNNYEFLYVADYGKEKNIKANFLGLTNEISKVEGELSPLEEKIVITISTQNGCGMSCRFCDAPLVGYGKNLSYYEIIDQVLYAWHYSGVSYTKRLNLHFARMGEPTLNPHIIQASLFFFDYFENLGSVNVFHPVISTMVPKNSIGISRNFIQEWASLKNGFFKGDAGLQFSINSTDNDQRDYLFNKRSASLEEIADIGKNLPNPTGRKYCLNFCITKDSRIDAEKLSMLFDPKRFMVKITPMHNTQKGRENGLISPEGYVSYDLYREYEQRLINRGFDVIVFIPSIEEEDGRITCGNAILSDKIKLEGLSNQQTEL